VAGGLRNPNPNRNFFHFVPPVMEAGNELGGAPNKPPDLGTATWQSCLIRAHSNTRDFPRGHQNREV
jgi:hypothetical protein